MEGLQGSGKSTLVRKMAELRPELKAVMEGEYSPVELAWCAYLEKDEYLSVLSRFPELSETIKQNTFTEENGKVICYTKVRTEDSGFYADLERYEIYNGRVSFEQFREIILGRYRKWNGDGCIFECSLFQNTVEEMMLFRCATDDDIMELYRDIRDALSDKEYRIVYLRSEDITRDLDTIRKERTGSDGKEGWFEMMCRYFDCSPYAVRNGVAGEEALIRHLRHRMQLELRICGELFPERTTVVRSRGYTEEDISLL